MEIGRRIYELRKAKGLTQEQLAEAVGVSVPAVSKWETGISLPDITMLAPVARLLSTTVDYLLAYTMDLTEEETDALYQEITNTCESKGYRLGLEYAFSLLKEYPGSEYLKLKIAMSPLRLSYTADSDYSEEEYMKLSEKSKRLLEDLVPSKNYEISFAAKTVLISRYMQEQRFHEAEDLLSTLPKNEFGVKRLWPVLYAGMEEYEKSLRIAEQNLLQDIYNIQTDIVSMYNVRIKQEDYQSALQLAENCYRISKLYGNHMPGGADLFVDAYIKMQDVQNALTWFQVYVEDIIELEPDFSKSVFFKNIGKDIANGSHLSDNIKTALYKAILLNPHYEILRDKKEYVDSVAKLKAYLNR